MKKKKTAADTISLYPTDFWLVCHSTEIFISSNTFIEREARTKSLLREQVKEMEILFFIYIAVFMSGIF